MFAREARNNAIESCNLRGDPRMPQSYARRLARSIRATCAGGEFLLFLSPSYSLYPELSAGLTLCASGGRASLCSAWFSICARASGKKYTTCGQEEAEIESD